MYGRARRIAFVKYVAIALVFIFIGYFLFTKVFVEEVFVDHNQNFEYLKSYFNDKGYICEMIENSGGRCYLDTDTTYNGFIRYDDGFNYVAEANSYRLTINYMPFETHKIVFKTNSNSLAEYRNKVYYCTCKDDNLLGELDKCVTEHGEELNVNSYLGIVEKAQNDVNEILTASGYNVEYLLDNYEWQK